MERNYVVINYCLKSSNISSLYEIADIDEHLTAEASLSLKFQLTQSWRDWKADLRSLRSSSLLKIHWFCLGGNLLEHLWWSTRPKNPRRRRRHGGDGLQFCVKEWKMNIEEKVISETREGPNRRNYQRGRRQKRKI